MSVSASFGDTGVTIYDETNNGGFFDDLWNNISGIGSGITDTGGSILGGGKDLFDSLFGAIGDVGSGIGDSFQFLGSLIEFLPYILLGVGGIIIYKYVK